MNRTLVFAALSAVLFVTPSCSESEAASAAGTYTVDVKPTVDGIIATEAAGKEISAEEREMMDNMFKGMFEKMTMTLNADLTFSGEAEMSMMGTTKKSSSKGTWTIDKGTVTLNMTHEDGAEKKSTQKGTYKDGKMQVEMEQDGKKVTLHLIKKK